VYTVQGDGVLEPLGLWTPADAVRWASEAAARASTAVSRLAACARKARAIDSGRAKRGNETRRTRLGWAKHAESIGRMLGLGSGATATAFAEAVARWQCGNGLAVDGIIGPNTWLAMSRALGLDQDRPRAPSSGFEPVPTRLRGRWCGPRGGGVAKDRCPPGVRPPCPRIQRLLCASAVSGAPFKYVADNRRRGIRRIVPDPSTGIFRVVSRQEPRLQRFVPEVAEALIQFLDRMQSLGLPVAGILTMGSLYCRCIRNTDRLSNHSFGDAIDIAGVEWGPGSPSSLPDTIIHNHEVALWYWKRDGRPVATKGPLVEEQTRLIRRINACLRLSFRTVLDYYMAGHRDHFHCDLRRTPDGSFVSGRRLGRGSRSTWAFVQEALSVVYGRVVKRTGRLDDPTRELLAKYAGRGADLFRDGNALDSTLDRLFWQVARQS
jgi:hypothetical protein